MKVALFYHSFASCWNHGNAHFLRGVARALVAVGHEVSVFEPADSWSRANALRERHGAAALREAEALVPGVRIRFYRPGTLDPDAVLWNFDLVIVHEWTDAAVASAIGRARAHGAPFVLLFHDTHHRMVSAPEDIHAMELDGYDGILAFGETLREAYRKHGWGRSAFVWHEAADTHLFRPAREGSRAVDVVWIGNWGDEERTEELRRYFIRPVASLGLRADVYGVRYPEHALAELRRQGIRHLGWAPNHHVPHIFARAKATVHIPRGYYTKLLRGIPTIRMFEALACGMPLVSAPWHDDENLFPPGSYVKASSAGAMKAALRAVVADAGFAADLATNALTAIRERHTCTHRVRELLAICAGIRNARVAVEPPRLAEAV